MKYSMKCNMKHAVKHVVKLLAALLLAFLLVRADDSAEPVKPLKEVPVPIELQNAWKEAVGEYNKIQQDPAVVAARAVMQFAAKQVQTFCEKRAMVPKDDGQTCVAKPEPSKAAAEEKGK